MAGFFSLRAVKAMWSTIRTMVSHSITHNSTVVTESVRHMLSVTK